MEIQKGIEINDLSLYLKEHNTLVIGDVHLGFEEALAKQGVLVPRFQYKDTTDRLARILSGLPRLDAAVINGDLKHEFGEISTQEWREIIKLIDFVLKHAEKIILVKGNHDVILYPIAAKREIKVQDYLRLGDIYIAHGHEIPENQDFRESKIVIIGNEHPAVSIRDGARSELFKCFVHGNWKGKSLIVMPSFNVMTTGTDLLREKFLSPFLSKNISEYKVFIAADETYNFGKLKNLK